MFMEIRITNGRKVVINIDQITRISKYEYGGAQIEFADNNLIIVDDYEADRLYRKIKCTPTWHPLKNR